jgi:integrase
MRSDSEDTRTKVLALCFLTGRRTTEILGTARFHVVTGSTHCARFEGQLKHKGVSREFIIPMLAPVVEIQECLAHVREKLNLPQLTVGVEHEDARMLLNHLHAGPLQRRLLKLMKPYTKDKITVHDLRGLYFHLAFEAQQTNCTAMHFGKHVLGHDHIKSTTTYARFRIKGLDSIDLHVDYLPEYFCV